MSAKIAAPGLLKIMVLWNKGYDIINPAHDVTNKILSCDSNYIVDVVMWLKFGNSSISMRNLFCFLYFHFLTGGLGSSSIIWDWQ